MATNFPFSLDTFLTILGSDRLKNALSAKRHSVLHTNLGDAIEALETKVGINGSPDTSSLDYKATANAAAAASALAAATAAQTALQWPPTEHGLKAWNFDPMLVSGNTATSASGVLQFQAIYIPVAMTISNIHFHLQGAGTSVTQAVAALYSGAGALLSQSTSAPALFNSLSPTAFRTAALNTPQAVAPGRYYIGYWCTYTGTAPQFFGGFNSVGPGNSNLSAPNLRFGITADVGLAATAPATMGAQTLSARPVWVAVS